MKVPDYNVAVAAAGAADLVVRGDGESVAGRGGRRQLRLDARSGSGQIPDGQRAGLAADYQRPSIREDFTGADVVISVLIGGENSLRSDKNGGKTLSVDPSVHPLVSPDSPAGPWGSWFQAG